MSQGGGFYANVNGNSPYSQSSPGLSRDATRRSELSHSIRPMSIAQLYKATQAHADAEWKIDSYEIGQVTFVAHVITITKQATNCLHMVEDGSGGIEVRHWNEPNNDEDTGKWGHIEENQYARVTGNLKSFGQKRYVNATSIRAADGIHELYFHILETITTNLIQSRGPPGAQPRDTSSITSGSGKTSAYTAQLSGETDDMTEYAGLPPLQRQIISIILSRPEQDAGGVHVGTIAKLIGGGQDKAANISNALDALMDAGYIFTTSDEAHFQVSR